MWPNPQFTADLVTFTKKSLMENFIFCAVFNWNSKPDSTNQGKLLINVQGWPKLWGWFWKMNVVEVNLTKLIFNLVVGFRKRVDF